MMSNLKLGVEVISAIDLMPKDKESLCSPFVELHFDKQRFRTTTKDRDPSPMWNEIFYFNISNSDTFQDETLEAHVYNHNKVTSSRSLLGKVRISGTSFVPIADAVVLHYPLEKRIIFSRARGELGLKVFYTDDQSVRSSNPLPEVVSNKDSRAPRFRSPSSPAKVSSLVSDMFSPEKQRVFRNLPNSNQPQEQRVFRNLPNSNQPQEQVNPVPPVATQPQRMKSENAVRVNPVVYSNSQSVDHSIKEINPFLGGGQIVGGKVIRANRPVSTYDLVEQMMFLFVRVVKARNLPNKDFTGSLDPYVEVKIGNYKGITKQFQKNQDPEWNEVFAYSRDNLQSDKLEVIVMDKDLLRDDFVGRVRFDLNEVPTRVVPDSPLAPEWYRLEEESGEKTAEAELMLAVWYGTQSDEVFPDACYSDAYSSSSNTSHSSSIIRSKVYHSPRLWYLRVNVVEAHDLILYDKGTIPNAYLKLQIGNQIAKTKAIQTRSLSPRWDEEFMFVVAEPFEDHLVVSVENIISSNKSETIGKVAIPLSSVEKRADNRVIHATWHNLDRYYMSTSAETEEQHAKNDKHATRVHLRICLDGGYHVFDESTSYSSDLRPTAKQLWKPSVGVLEVGILNANGIQPMKSRDGRGTSDTYCVAKYGQKWVRTRTIIDNLNPKYNEQYMWEVHDPSTVLTLGVFDNNQVNDANTNTDQNIGKVRVRISTLETNRVYTHSYPLLVLHPNGVKKMGELNLAIRFSYTSMTSLMLQYSKPLLPKMHYKKPLTLVQQEMLRYQAVAIVAARLSRSEPPLRREVIEYMSDTKSHQWSMRRSKANFYRVMSVCAGVLAAGTWLADVATWKSPITTILAHFLYIALVCFPQMILPTTFLYMSLIGFWNYYFRPRHPPHMNTKLSHADQLPPDELDEEFETFPSTRPSDVVRFRYDRLRSVAAKVQSVVGDIATQGERIQALLSWRDSRATFIFVIGCLLAGFILYVTPFQVFMLFGGLFLMRHPKLRGKLPSPLINFFRRLPAMTDSML